MTHAASRWRARCAVAAAITSFLVVASTAPVDGATPAIPVEVMDRADLPIAEMPWVPVDVNAGGQVLVSAAYLKFPQSIVWQPDGSVVDLGGIYATDINDAGVVVGSGVFGGARRIDVATGVTQPLDGPDVTRPAKAAALDDAGNVVGFTQAFSPSGTVDPLAAAWAPDNTYVGLDPLGLGSIASTINATGVVGGVAFFGPGLTEPHPVVWDLATGAARDLQPIVGPIVAGGTVVEVTDGGLALVVPREEWLPDRSTAAVVDLATGTVVWSSITAAQVTINGAGTIAYVEVDDSGAAISVVRRAVAGGAETRLPTGGGSMPILAIDAAGRVLAALDPAGDAHTVVWYPNEAVTPLEGTSLIGTVLSDGGLAAGWLPSAEPALDEPGAYLPWRAAVPAAAPPEPTTTTSSTIAPAATATPRFTG